MIMATMEVGIHTPGDSGNTLHPSDHRVFCWPPDDVNDDDVGEMLGKVRKGGTDASEFNQRKTEEQEEARGPSVPRLLRTKTLTTQRKMSKRSRTKEVHVTTKATLQAKRNQRKVTRTD